MWDLKACAVCFSTGAKLHSFNIGTLRKDFKYVSGIQMVQGNGMPGYLCVECTAYVIKFKKFRDKCHRAHYALQQMLCTSNEIKKSHLNNFSRAQLKLMPTLSYMSLDRTRTMQAQFKLVDYCRKGVSQPPGLIPVSHCSTLPNEDAIELDMKVAKGDDLECQIKTEKEQPAKVKNVATGLLNQFLPDQNGVETRLPDLLNDEEISSKSLLKTDLDMDVNGDMFDHMDDHKMDDSDSDGDDEKFDLASCQLSNKVDGASATEEYGDLVPIAFKEAKAAYEVHKFFTVGQYKCDCGKSFDVKKTYEQHCRRHNLHISGTYRCEICDVYFKTAFTRETHMSLQHMYKYLCRSCPEVSFSRRSAKLHFVSHSKPSTKRRKVSSQSNSWISAKGEETERKNNVSAKPKKASKKVPKDFLMYTPQTQEEQYRLVQQRKESRNYLEAKFRCELCFRGYRLTSTYNKHMAKHDPTVSGVHQCDVCKHFFRNTRSLYKHMCMYHLRNYSCQYCDFKTTNKGQAINHYKWHKNVTYDCPHCDKKFNKISTQLTHIRFKHPGTDICNLCGHSYVSSSGLNCHKIVSHSKQEIEASEALTLRPDPTSPLYCGDCRMQFGTEQAYVTHLGSSKNHVETNISSRSMMSRNRRISRVEGGTPAEARGAARGRRTAANNSALGSSVLNTGTTTPNSCDVCGKFLASDVLARRHYEADHPGTDYLKRYMCHVCGHATKQYANLLVHMRTHTREKPYECPHCDRRFSMPSNRDRHLVVHTGEKRYQCQHCSRRFTQSTAVKLHIQTVHMKIPYKPWDKKNRKRRKDAQPTTAEVPMTDQMPASMSVELVPQHKLLIDPQGEYITYISYTEDQ